MGAWVLEIVWLGIQQQLENMFGRLHKWRGADKKYTSNDGCKWLDGQQKRVGWYHWVWNNYNVPNTLL